MSMSPGCREVPINETIVWFDDCSGAGFEKVDGLCLNLKVARDIWIAKLDFQLYPQQPPQTLI